MSKYTILSEEESRLTYTLGEAIFTDLLQLHTRTVGQGMSVLAVAAAVVYRTQKMHKNESPEEFAEEFKELVLHLIDNFQKMEADGAVEFTTIRRN